MLRSKYLLKYYKKYLGYYIIGILTLIFVDYIQLFIPEFIGILVGEFKTAALTGSFTDTARATIVDIVGKTILIGAGLFFGRMLWRFTLFRASHKIEAGIRHDMFLKAERLSVNYFHYTKVGNVMSWFASDIDEVQEYLGFGVVMMVDGFGLGLMTFYKMFKLSWQFTLLLLIPLLLIVVWGLLVEKYMSENWTNRQKTFDDLFDFTRESFSGIRVIKAFVKQKHELRAFSKVAKKNKDYNVKFATIHASFDVAIEVVIGLIFAVILGFGGYLAITGNTVRILWLDIAMSPENMVTYTGYFDTLIWPLIAMGQIVSMHSRCSASMKRIDTYLDSPEDIKDCENPIILENVKGKIEFDHFTFVYPDNPTHKPYLIDVCLTINPGESVGVVGKIGCGKTTLANSLLRIYNVDSNSIRIDDNDIMKCQLKSLRQCIAYVPQDNFLFSDSIRRNIAFSDVDLPMEEVKDAAKFSCVDQDIEGFQNQYETITGERGVTLSGGQKQRISIARAFIKNSPIMIFDDSVSAVDVKTEDTILKNIKTLRKGKTTIVIASRVSTVCHLDKIIVLNEGRVEAFDTPANLLKTSPTYAKMVYLQELEKEVEGR